MRSHSFQGVLCTQFIRLVLTMVSMALVSGCASAPEGSPGAVDDLARPPADFTLNVAILVGALVPDRTLVQERPGHFVLLPDGTLLHESGRQVDWGQRPGRVRSLYQKQVADLWQIAKDLGFTNPGSGDFAGNPGLIQPQREQTIYIIAFAAEGRRWTFVRSFEPGQAPDAASVRLIRALADLAWVGDLPPDRLLPVRYDFGPEPHAGFRRRGEQ